MNAPSLTLSAYTNDAQQRILSILMHMCNDVVRGYTPGAIARAFEVSGATATRDLDNLRTAGLAEVDELGTWRITPRMAQQALKVMTSLDRAEQKLAETRQRFTRTA